MHTAPMLLRAVNAATRHSVTLLPGARHAARISLPVCVPARASLSTSTAVASGSGATSTSVTGSKPRKPSPYRLPTLPTFREQFAPLHAAGWRLQLVESGADAGAGQELQSGLDLQAHRLVRAYAFPRDRAGWRALRTFVSDVAEVVELEDHHPVITAAPSSDLPADAAALATPETYAVFLATLTHTPMPPIKVEFDGRPKPGVTGKDLRLAERVEELYRRLSTSTE